MDNIAPSTKIDLRYANEDIAFRISDCCTKNKYSLSKLSRNEAKEFVNSLKEQEKKTWKQLSANLRNTGLTSERPNTNSYQMIDEENSSPSKITGEKYYFHFRTKATGVYRVFGYQWKKYFFITHIDTKGKIHDH